MEGSIGEYVDSSVKASVDAQEKNGSYSPVACILCPLPKRISAFRRSWNA